MFKNRKLFLFVFASLLISFGVLISFAADKEKEKPKTSTEPAVTDNTAVSEGLSADKVAKDPEGTLRAPNDKEDKELSAALKNTLRKYPKAVVKTGPHGELSLVVAPHYMSFSVATVGPDGKVVLKCVDSPKKVDDKKSADEEQYPEE